MPDPERRHDIAIRVRFRRIAAAPVEVRPR